VFKWLKSKIVLSQTPKSEPMHVRMTSESVEILSGDDVKHALKLDDIQSVKILTTDDGPFAPDVFFILETSQTNCPPIAQGMDGVDALVDYITALPGADMAAFIGAMGSTVPNLFHIWSRKDG